MRNVILAVLLTMSLGGYAQVDTDTNTVGIPLPESATPPADRKSDVLPSVTDPLDAPRGTIPKKKNNFSMIPQDEFKNPGERYLGKLNDKLQKDLDYNRYVGLPLGNYQTSSPYVFLYLRDHGDIDGDRLQLRNNEKILVSGMVLERQFQKIKVYLKNGLNTIDIIAMSTGIYGDNTAEYEIFDASGQQITSSAWYLPAGYKAVITIDRL